MAAPLPPAGPRESDTATSRALLARLTGFEAESQACRFYLNEANGDVEAAVRLAVQGAILPHPAVDAANNQGADANTAAVCDAPAADTTDTTDAAADATEEVANVPTVAHG